MFPTRTRQPLLAALLVAACQAQAATTLVSESFDDVGALAADGWLLANVNPDPAFAVDWYQGLPDVFAAHGGTPDAYIASSWGAAAPGTTLQNWLITPAFSTAQAGTVTFWMRGAADAGFVDTVRFGFSDGSGATTQFALGDTVVAAGAWTQVSVGFAAGGAGSTGRFAIEHTGPDDLADYVGIDDLSVQANAVTAVAEPANALLLAAGVAALAAWRRRTAR
jgi:MYXO-CTERM domain-containing protein